MSNGYYEMRRQTFPTHILLTSARKRRYDRLVIPVSAIEVVGVSIEQDEMFVTPHTGVRLKSGDIPCVRETPYEIYALITGNAYKYNYCKRHEQEK